MSADIVLLEVVPQATQDLAFSSARLSGHRVGAAKGTRIAVPNGPPAKAGMRGSDLILFFNRTMVETSAQLPPVVTVVGLGGKVTLKVWRHRGAAKPLNVKVCELSNRQIGNVETHLRAALCGLGLVVPSLTPHEMQTGVRGRLLLEQARGLARAGMQQGDIVPATDGTSLKSIAQLGAIIAKSGKRVALRVERKGVKIFVPMDFG